MWLFALVQGCGFASSTPPTLRSGPHGFCLLASGSVSCWGAGPKGMHGATYGEPCDEGRCARQPQKIDAYDGAEDIQLGSRTVQVRRRGAVSVRGNHHWGALGLPSATAPLDTLKQRSDGATWIRSTKSATCEGRADGSAWCAGLLHSLTEAPDTCGSYGDRCARSPVKLEDSQVVDVQTGTYGACVLRRDGSVRCTPGKHSDGFDQARDVAALAVGHWHTCVLKKDASVWCSGWNAHGQIGNGQVGAADAPTVPPTRVLDQVEHLATEDSTTCAIKTDKSLWCWGRNELGQAGQAHTEAEVPTPSKVEGLPGVVGVALSSDASCAVGEDSSLWCWGGHTHGELGLGDAALDRCKHGSTYYGEVGCVSRPRKVR